MAHSKRGFPSAEREATLRGDAERVHPMAAKDMRERADEMAQERVTERDVKAMPELTDETVRPDFNYPKSGPLLWPKRSRQDDYRENWENSIENSLLKLMKEGELIRSKVGMPRKNVTKDLEKVVLPQTMGQKPGVMNPVAKRTAPLAAQSSLPTAAEGEAGVSQDVDVGRMLQYGAYQQAGGVADKLLGIKQPGDETGTLPGAVAGGVKAGMGAAKKIGSLFGGGKKQPETLKSSSGMPPSNQNTQQNYYSRDIK
jgi:hypothetical protein